MRKEPPQNNLASLRNRFRILAVPLIVVGSACDDDLFLAPLYLSPLANYRGPVSRANAGNTVTAHHEISRGSLNAAALSECADYDWRVGPQSSDNGNNPFHRRSPVGRRLGVNDEGRESTIGSEG